MTQSLSAFTTLAKLLVLKRTQRRCDRCGFPITAGWQFHHRLPRRMGGSSDAVLGMAANCLLLHPRCHDHIESHRAESRLRGLLLSPSVLPEEVPVRLWSGWVLLDNDGGVSPVDEPAARL